MGRKKAAEPATAAEEVPEVPAEVVWDETNDPFGLRRQAANVEVRSRSPRSCLRPLPPRRSPDRDRVDQAIDRWGGAEALCSRALRTVSVD
jgi:hypothetical protein